MTLHLPDGQSLNPLENYHLYIQGLRLVGIAPEKLLPLERRVTFPEFERDPNTGAVVPATQLDFIHLRSLK